MIKLEKSFFIFKILNNHGKKLKNQMVLLIHPAQKCFQLQKYKDIGYFD